MGIINSHLIGRLGNQMFQYAFSRAYAEQNGLTLHTNAWEGQKIFEINDPPLRDGPRLEDGYRQRQEDLIYTRDQARGWFRVRGDIYNLINSSKMIVGHLRRGDYAKCGYVLVSKESYEFAKEDHTGLSQPIHYVSEESATDELSHIRDFLYMVNTQFLFRANSSFSWWAATLGNAHVFSPVVTGLEGGKEHFCAFVPGNHPRFCDLPVCTDLYLT